MVRPLTADNFNSYNLVQDSCIYRGLLVLEEQRLAARLHLVMEVLLALADYSPLLDYVL